MIQAVRHTLFLHTLMFAFMKQKHDAANLFLDALFLLLAATGSRLIMQKALVRLLFMAYKT